MGLLWLKQVSSSESSTRLASSINFTPLYFWSSFALNSSMTLAIVTRLLVFRRRISSVSRSKLGSEYPSIAAILVESAVIYPTGSLLFLIPFALNNSLFKMFIQVLTEIQVCFRLVYLFGFSFFIESDRSPVVDYISNRIRKIMVQRHNYPAYVGLRRESSGLQQSNKIRQVPGSNGLERIKIHDMYSIGSNSCQHRNRPRRDL